MNSEVISVILKTLEEIHEQQDLHIAQPLTDKTPLFGQEGILDSLGLVTLVVAVEQAIEDEFGVSISLADEKAMSQRHSPYRTIGSLAEYARQMIQTVRANG
jgi:D-alanine--poly(phosphoribitol) ligase subunit 2